MKNRKIKFRGKVKDCNDWRYGYLTHNEESGKSWIGSFVLGEYCFVEVEPETVGQFTEIKDAYGVGIYDGDIVNILIDGEWLDGHQIVPEYIETFTIVFEECKFKILWKGDTNDFDPDCLEEYYEYGGELKVTGNIHEKQD